MLFDSWLENAPSKVLGGTAPGAGNLISGNKARNVYLTHTVSSQANSTVVQGNYIGTDVTGTQALHNGLGLVLDGGNSNLIGGTTAGARNLLAEGIAVHCCSGNLVQGNYMGTDVTGKIVLAGIAYSFNPHSPGNTIGGTTPAAGNLIYSEPVSLAGHAVVLSAAPVLTSAVSSNGTVTIGGTLHRGLNSAYTLNFFSDAAGTIPIGSSIVTTDATGTATFTATFSGVLSAGEVITATSGDGLYNTSMLSASLAVPRPSSSPASHRPQRRARPAPSPSRRRTPLAIRRPPMPPRFTLPAATPRRSCQPTIPSRPPIRACTRLRG